MFKYVPTPPVTRLQLAAESLKWRHVAPTAPDTLWCYPYLNEDPFIMNMLPDLYIVGNQPQFATKLVVGDSGHEGRCRVVLVPKFVESGTLVLVNLSTLAVKTVQFDITL
jgi:DNA polymerase delta subunit 2